MLHNLLQTFQPITELDPMKDRGRFIVLNTLIDDSRLVLLIITLLMKETISWKLLAISIMFLKM